MPLVPIRSYEHLYHAEQDQLFLEEHGIPTLLENAFTNAAYSFLGQAAGGPILTVPAERRQEAVHLLRDLHGLAPAAPGQERGYDGVVCPNCGSLSITTYRPYFWTVPILGWLFFPFAWPRRYRCQDCERRFSV